MTLSRRAAEQQLSSELIRNKEVKCLDRSNANNNYCIRQQDQVVFNRAAAGAQQRSLR